MKIVAKPIDVVVTFINGKWPTPHRFKYLQDNKEKQEIRIDKVLNVEESHMAGIDAIVYTCQSAVENQQKIYQLKYIIGKYRWELYKI